MHRAGRVWSKSGGHDRLDLPGIILFPRWHCFRAAIAKQSSRQSFFWRTEQTSTLAPCSRDNCHGIWVASKRLEFIYCHITKASGARLEFSLALAVVAVKVLKTKDPVIYHRMGGGGGVDCDSFTAKHRFGGGGRGGGPM